jgi:hypothetical protein
MSRSFVLANFQLLYFFSGPAQRQVPRHSPIFNSVVGHAKLYNRIFLSKTGNGYIALS